MCSSCDPFDIHISIHGPAQLRRVVAKIQKAVRSRILDCAPAGPDRDFIAQKPFLDLDLAEGLPDGMIYEFNCNRCGAAFGLEVETYHGQGGSWSKV